MSFSCVIVYTPFVSDFDDEGPSRGLRKSIGCSVKRLLSNEASESNEGKDD